MLRSALVIWDAIVQSKQSKQSRAISVARAIQERQVAVMKVRLERKSGELDGDAR